MRIHLNANPICLTRTQALTLADARGSSIHCRHGRVWITQNGDPRDIVLVAGERFTLDRDSPAIVTAIRDSSVELHAQPHAASLAASLGDLWRRARVAFVRGETYGPRPRAAH